MTFGLSQPPSLATTTSEIQLQRPNKLDILADLHKVTESSRRECIEKRWRYTQKTGETVILRDLFDKVIKWIDLSSRGIVAMRIVQCVLHFPGLESDLLCGLLAR